MAYSETDLKYDETKSVLTAYYRLVKKFCDKYLAVTEDCCTFAADFDFHSEMTMNNSQKVMDLPIVATNAE